MIERAPSRTQRSKGIKVKHVLQLCLLLGVCFWLIYQVKYSHDRKKEFDDKDAKVSVKALSSDEILKLGRKDLPQVKEAAKNERHEDEEEEENKPEEEEKKVREREERDTVEGHEESNKHDEEEHEDGVNKHEDEEQEEEENKNEEPEEAGSKHEEEEQEEESKNEETEDERRGGENEEKEDERRGGGDDELDEQDQERTEGEADRKDGFIDEEKERVGEGGDDRESEGSEGEDKNNQVENENSLDDHDHEGVNRNTHVAREEHYTADDAVSHDNQIIISETEKANSENSNENFERNVLEEENKSNTTNEISGNQKDMELKLGEGEMAESGSALNATTAEEKDHGAGSYNSQELPPLTANNTSTEEGTEIRNNSTGLSTELTGSSLQNGTETKLDANPTPALNLALDGATNIDATDLQTTRLERTNDSYAASNGNQFDSNTNISTKTVDADAGTGDSFNNSSPALSETLIKLNTTAADGEVSSGSSEMNKTADTTQNETSNSNSESGGTIKSWILPHPQL